MRIWWMRQTLADAAMDGQASDLPGCRRQSAGCKSQVLREEILGLWACDAEGVAHATGPESKGGGLGSGNLTKSYCPPKVGDYVCGARVR